MRLTIIKLPLSAYGMSGFSGINTGTGINHPHLLSGVEVGLDLDLALENIFLVDCYVGTSPVLLSLIWGLAGIATLNTCNYEAGTVATEHRANRLQEEGYTPDDSKVLDLRAKKISRSRNDKDFDWSHRYQATAFIFDARYPTFSNAKRLAPFSGGAVGNDQVFNGHTGVRRVGKRRHPDIAVISSNAACMIATRSYKTLSINPNSPAIEPFNTGLNAQTISLEIPMDVDV